MKGLLALLFAAFAVVALLRGQIGVTGRAITRIAKPRGYWIRVVMYCVASAVFAWLWLAES